MKPIYGLPVCFPPVDTEDKGLGSMDSSNTFSVAASIMQLQLYRPFSTYSALALPGSEDTGMSPQDTHSSLSPGTGRKTGPPTALAAAKTPGLVAGGRFFFFSRCGRRAWSPPRSLGLLGSGVGGDGCPSAPECQEPAGGEGSAPLAAELRAQPFSPPRSPGRGHPRAQRRSCLPRSLPTPIRAWNQ